MAWISGCMPETVRCDIDIVISVAQVQLAESEWPHPQDDRYTDVYR